MFTNFRCLGFLGAPVNGHKFADDGPVSDFHRGRNVLKVDHLGFASNGSPMMYFAIAADYRPRMDKGMGTNFCVVANDGIRPHDGKRPDGNVFPHDYTGIDLRAFMNCHLKRL